MYIYLTLLLKRVMDQYSLGYREEEVDWADYQANRLSRNQTPTPRRPVEAVPLTGASYYRNHRPTNTMSYNVQTTGYDDMISSSQVREIVVQGIAKARYDRPVVTHAYLNSAKSEYRGFTPKHLASKKWTI